VYTGKEWSVFRNVECISGKSGVNLEMSSEFGERVERNVECVSGSGGICICHHMIHRYKVVLIKILTFRYHKI